MIDGVDRGGVFGLGEGQGRRDHVFIYQPDKMAALVKEYFKLYIPGPGENFVVAPFHDLLRDPREQKPAVTPVGAWAGAPFERIIKRHDAWKKKYPDTVAPLQMPYTGIESLRPETIRMREEWLAWQRQIGTMD